MSLRTLLILFAGAAVVGGALLGLLCAPFMYSQSIVDVTGAGLGCVTAAILIASGLRTLTALVESKATPEPSR